jgi:Helix-turn-helix of DDE superfamily endonuclease
LISYRATLDVSLRSLHFTRNLIARHRRELGGSGHRLAPGRQAVLALIYLRKGETFTQLAADFAVGVTTAWRYVHQILALLATLGRRSLAQALAACERDRFVVLDGTCIRIDRVADRRYWCGKHRC